MLAQFPGYRYLINVSALFFTLGYMTRSRGFLLVLWLFASPLSATVKLALAAGASCNLCHVTPSGGGLRNSYGLEEIILGDLPRPRAVQSAATGFSTNLNPNLRWGLDGRIQAFNYLRPDTLTPSSSGIFPMQLTAYVNVILGPALDIYAAHYLLQTTIEWWGRFTAREGSRYVRVGRFLPAYGLRLDDHTSFIRGGNTGGITQGGLNKEGLPFGPRIHGGGAIEGGGYLGDLHLSASLSNPFLPGSKPAGPFFEGMTLALRGELTQFLSGPNLNIVAGASYLKDGDLRLGGLFGGVTRNSLTMLAEVDLITDWAGARITSLASYLEVDLLVVQGLHAFLKYDRYNDDMALQENSLTRFTLGGEWFPLPFVELKPQLRVNTTTVPGKSFTIDILLQLHIFI